MAAFKTLCIKNRITVKQKYEQVEYSEVLKKGGLGREGGRMWKGVLFNKMRSTLSTILCHLKRGGG